MIEYAELAVDKVYQLLNTSEKGISEREAARRLQKYGLNRPVTKKEKHLFLQFLARFTNPLVIVLLVIAGFSLFFGGQVSALLVIAMAVMSVLLSFFQEYRAGKEAEKLSEMVHTTATVIRDGRTKEIKLIAIVPGDIVDLSAGDMIPGDIRIVSSKDLFINQASLTGESLPVEKFPGIGQDNFAYLGSSVVSGSALGIVIKTGAATRFGEMAKAINAAAPPTSFDRGIKDFTWLMIRFMLIFVVFIFLVNYFFKGSFVEALLFSLAVAVGLTPEMLPMIVTVNLSKGAMTMAKKEVIVKRLSSIQNIGAMDILCTDKTGTLTLDQVVLEKYCDVAGQESRDVLTMAYVNSNYQTGLKNLLDKAILKHEKLLVKEYSKVDEIPFDYERRIMSVVIEHDGVHRLVAKGAPEEIFRRCTKYEQAGEIKDINPSLIQEIEEEYYALSREGFRVLALAYKDVEKSKTVFNKTDESALILKGYLAFLDPPKPTAKQTIADLKKLGIELKILTGDNELVTKKICAEINLSISGLANGEQVEKCAKEELLALVKATNIFVRLSPAQKEKIILALQQAGHTVGFLGDGINDGAALKASDVGISVNNSADVAKESADIILLRKSLRILKEAVIEGRKTFGNIVKYLKMGSSSNFGNMLSMTGSSLFLPFLPMLPAQILLNNFLYDLSQIALPSDEVDREFIVKPRPWNVAGIRNFMVTIGPVSSIFDFLTFAAMFFIFKAGQPLFHTGWFLESLITQTLVIHVIRTNKIPFIESRPSRFLLVTSIFIIALGLGVVYSPLGPELGFIIPPANYFFFLLPTIIAYLLLVQGVKRWFIARFSHD